MREQVRARGAVLLLGIIAMVALAAGPPARTAKESSVERIPDPGYAAKRGDHAMLYGYSPEKDALVSVLAPVNADVYLAYWRSVEVGDRVEIDRLIAAGDVARPDQKTAVLVLEVERFGAEDPRHDLAVVRVESGKLRGAKLWVPTYSVCRLVENPAYVPPAPMAPDPKDKSIGAVRARIKAFYDLPPEEQRAIRDAARRDKAEVDLAIAENLRKSGKATAAKKAYEAVVKNYSDLPEAAKARERLGLPAKK
jgi:hypothetical protein